MSKERASYQLVKHPREQRLRAIARDFKLDAAAAAKLEDTVLDALGVLTAYRSQPNAEPNRSLRIRRLKNIDKYLRLLRGELARAKDDLGVILPFATRSALGEGFTFSTLQRLISPEVKTTNTDLMIAVRFEEAKEPGTTPPTILDLEEHSRGARQAAGLKHGGDLLRNHLAELHAPITQWLKLDRLDKGGRTVQLERQYLAYRLAEACPEILGRAAPVAVTGTFVDLCERVFEDCGLSKKGVLQLVPRVVRQLRAAAAKERDQ